METISATSRAICHRLLRNPRIIDAIAAKARGGDEQALESIIAICWLMAGLACSAEEDLIRASVETERRAACICYGSAPVESDCGDALPTGVMHNNRGPSFVAL